MTCFIHIFDINLRTVGEDGMRVSGWRRVVVCTVAHETALQKNVNGAARSPSCTKKRSKSVRVSIFLSPNILFHWLRAFHLSSSLFSTPPTAQIKRRFLCHTTQGVVPHSLSCSSYSPFCDSSRSSLSPPIIPRCHPDPQTYNPPFRFLCVPLRPPRTSRPSWAESHRQRQAAAAPRAGGRVGCLPPTVFFFFFFFYKRGDGWQKTRQKATQHYCSPILRRFAFSGEASGSTS